MIMIVTMVVIVIQVADHERVLASWECVGAGPFERIFGFEKLRIEFGGPAEIEASHVEHVVEVHIAILCAMDARHAVDSLYPRFEGIEFSRGDEVRLVEENDISEADLLH
jgi:hypothetical protein